MTSSPDYAAKARELLPCPFCGAALCPLVRVHSAFHTAVAISKGQCWLQFAGPQSSPYELNERDYAVWNRRASGQAEVQAWRPTLQIALMVLCAAQEGQSWNSNFLRDFRMAITGLREILAALPSPPKEQET